MTTPDSTPNLHPISAEAPDELATLQAELTSKLASKTSTDIVSFKWGGKAVVYPQAPDYIKQGYVLSSKSKPSPVDLTAAVATLYLDTALIVQHLFEGIPLNHGFSPLFGLITLPTAFLAHRFYKKVKADYAVYHATTSTWVGPQTKAITDDINTINALASTFNLDNDLVQNVESLLLSTRNQITDNLYRAANLRVTTYSTGRWTSTKDPARMAGDNAAADALDQENTAAVQTSRKLANLLKEFATNQYLATRAGLAVQHSPLTKSILSLQDQIDNISRLNAAYKELTAGSKATLAAPTES